RKRDRLVGERNQRQVVEPSGRDRAHARETGRDAALATVVRTAAAPPDDDRAFAPQRDAVVVVRGDRDDAGESVGHAALAGVAAAAAPGHHGAVVSEGKAVRAAGRDRGHAREATGHAALSVVAGLVEAPPGDDGAVAPERETLIGAGRDRRHAGKPARHAALPRRVRAAAPGDDSAV